MSTPETRVLIVDDESAIRLLVRPSLEREGFRVEEAATGAAGLAAVERFHPHLILLDLGLPDLEGGEVLRRLREWTAIPIVVLTVADDPATKVRLLDAGADDYLTKPFNSAELLARVRVALRNRRAVEATPVFRSGDLEIDVNAGTVRVGGVEAKLTRTEFALLRVLAREGGRVVSQKQLLREVWGPAAEGETHYLRIYFAHVRKKIEADPASPKHVLTEPGVGYRLA